MALDTHSRVDQATMAVDTHSRVDLASMALDIVGHASRFQLTSFARGRLQVRIGINSATLGPAYDWARWRRQTK